MPSFDFKGKQAVEQAHLQVPHCVLRPDEALSHTPAPTLDDNLVIQGDNLCALSALLPEYAGSVRCAYLDPPYNTGQIHREYNDSANGPQQRAWLEEVVADDDLDRHDRWLCMMLPRLKLVHELLCDRGLLFVSIDDREVHHLRLLLDEIFGAEHFVATVIWEKVYSPRMNSIAFSISHDYILVYGKSAAALPNRQRFEQNQRQFSLVDPLSGRAYRRRSLRKEGKDSLRQDVPSLFFALEAPDGSLVLPIKPDGTEGRWRWSRDYYADQLAAGNVEWLRRDGVWEAYAKQYLNPQASHPPTTLWHHSEVGHNHEAQEELAALLGPRSFVTPKPVRLIRRILELATSPGSNDLVLDAFAGSGTTAHATLALNAADGGRRRFILVEQEAYTATLTAERLRRVITGVPGAKDPALRAGYGGSFTFVRVGA